MKIASWNVNGLRAINKNGFAKWLKDIDADIVCLQEIKAKQEDLPSELLSISGCYSFFNCAEKKGYSGVAIYTKLKPTIVEYSLGLERFDREGRIIVADFEKFLLINIYLPHGGREKENLDYKLEVYQKLFEFLEKNKDRKIVLIGDFNIAHQEIDLARPKQNQDNIMFTPKEREQIIHLIELGFIDSFREFNKNGGNYTWFSYRQNAREKGLGWRIDYAFVSQKLKNSLKEASILCNVRGSDHCPISLELNI